MPRRARIAVPGVPWHILQRGNNRSACFYAKQDYLRYLETWADLSSRYECEVHGYGGLIVVCSLFPFAGAAWCGSGF